MKGRSKYGSFMANKRWHTQNPANLKAVWIAENKVAEEKRRDAERAAELKKERELGDIMSKTSSGAAGIAFLYEAPPGLAEAQQREMEEEAKRRKQEQIEQQQQV